MKKLLCIGLLLASTEMVAATYCTAPSFKAETRFDGPVGLAGNTGIAKFFGSNTTNSNNIGEYIFKTIDELILEFPGEKRHFCTKAYPYNWNCRLGSLRYSLICEF
jgi:hypothetical protein